MDISIFCIYANTYCYYVCIINIHYDNEVNFVLNIISK